MAPRWDRLIKHLERAHTSTSPRQAPHQQVHQREEQQRQGARSTSTRLQRPRLLSDGAERRLQEHARAASSPLSRGGVDFVLVRPHVVEQNQRHEEEEELYHEVPDDPPPAELRQEGPGPAGRRPLRRRERHRAGVWRLWAVPGGVVYCRGGARRRGARTRPARWLRGFRWRARSQR